MSEADAWVMGELKIGSGSSATLNRSTRAKSAPKHTTARHQSRITHH
jgi:hypothetical protein